jgi:endonuclease III-like uncharacterized protein
VRRPVYHPGRRNHEGHRICESTKRASHSELYGALFCAWGPQHGWPAGSRFEVIVGAYLTQNTAWTNVERVLANLRAARLHSVKGIRRVRLAEFERLIRTSGYFRQKALRLKTKVALSENSAALAAMRKWWNDDIAPRIEWLVQKAEAHRPRP